MAMRSRRSRGSLQAAFSPCCRGCAPIAEDLPTLLSTNNRQCKAFQEGRPCGAGKQELKVTCSRSEAEEESESMVFRTQSMPAKSESSSSTKPGDAFEGKISASSSKCIVSFPGIHRHEWDGLVKLCNENSLSSACVYFNKTDPKHRFGKHSEDPEAEGLCYCTALYGETKPWGCAWFAAWRDNVEEAVEAGMELIVVFLPGQKDEGVVSWDDLAEEGERLWNKVGLGGSQKGEVAWLNRQGFEYTTMDVPEVNQRFGLRSAGVLSSFDSADSSIAGLASPRSGKDLMRQ